MARGATASRVVGFAQEIQSFRTARDDELSVMSHFAKHASRCPVCHDPYTSYKNDVALCDRGNALAMDVANYIYGKGGKPFSLIDRKNGDSVQIEVPTGCEVINSLCKAFCKGMSLKKRAAPIIVTPKRDLEVTKADKRASYHPAMDAVKVPILKERKYLDDSAIRDVRYGTVNMIEIAPARSRRSEREKVYYNDRVERVERKDKERERPKSGVYERKGSLYERDEEEKRRRKVYDDQPIVMIAEPRRRYVSSR